MESISFETLLENIIEEFKRICEIPHPSDKLLDHAPGAMSRCWNISCYLKQQLENDLHVNVNQDTYGNLWFDLPANDPKYAKYPVIAMQGHMDMVFSYDEAQFPLKPIPHKTKIEVVDEIKDGKRIIHSLNYKTNIGADNGIPVTAFRCLLKEPGFKHGPLRVIITNCEENACQGAALLVNKTNPNILKDIKYMLNLDGETAGEMVVGCSGAVGNYYEQTFLAENIAPNKNKFKLNVSHFTGGHSGLVVHNKITSALAFMSQLLKKLSSDKSLQLIDIQTPGTLVYNRIPTDCIATIATNKTEEEIRKAFALTVKKFKKMPKPELDKRSHEFAFENENWDEIVDNFVIERETKAKKCLSVKDTKAIIALQCELPNGLIAWPSDKDTAKFIGEQTSSNIAPASLTLSGDEVYFTYNAASYFRSSITENIEKSFLENAKIAHKRLGKAITMGPKASQKLDTCTFDAKFPAWPNNGLKLSNLAQEGWIAVGLPKEMTHFVRFHAGIECSWWCQAAIQTGGEIWQTNLGPTLHPCHEITETCEVETIIPFLKMVIYVVQNINKLEKIK